MTVPVNRPRRLQEQDTHHDYRLLSLNAQKVFSVIEEIMGRYLVDEMWITKEDIALELGISIPGVKVALRELKKFKYIESKNENSPIIRIGDIYKRQFKEN